MGPRKTRAGRAGELVGNGAGETRADVVAELERTGAFTAGGEGSAAGEPDAGTGASSSSAGPVGALAVEVNREQILAEAAAIAASSPSSSDVPAIAPASSAPALTVEAKAADVAPAVRMLVSRCCGTFAPNWEITKEEGDGVADAAALVMAYWMPDGILEPKYLAIISLATSLYGVAGARRLADGSWVPLRAPRAPSSSSSTPPSSPPAPSRPTLVV
jgi:hypothetical protein